jgi:hypothetical protein
VGLFLKGEKMDLSMNGLQALHDSDGDNTAQAVKTTMGKVFYFEVANINAADAFIQFFDAAAADVVVGTTAPKLSFLVAGGDATLYGSKVVGPCDGINFETAITYACTTTATGNGDPTVGLNVNILYQ